MQKVSSKHELRPNQWRATAATQSECYGSSNPTADLVQVAFLELHMTSRMALEGARLDDMSFLQSLEAYMRHQAHQYETAMRLVNEDCDAATQHLFHLEAEHWHFLQAWAGQERELASVNTQRRELVQATLHLCDKLTSRK